MPLSLSAHHEPASPIRIAKHLIFSFVFFLLFFQVLPAAQARNNSAKPMDQALRSMTFSLPPSYGKVIYRYNDTSPNTVYIIGISHRDSHTRQNGCFSVQTQLEVYKIGKWLNHYRNLDLLLPEGFFSPSGTQHDLSLYRHVPPPNETTLEKKLADNSHFINAEMLLLEHFPMRACQVENHRLYEAVLNLVCRFEQKHSNPAADHSLETKIERLQKKRTAAILHNIPAAIENEFQKGLIKHKNALLTIGLDHIATIINFLKEGRINSQANVSHPASKESTAYDSELKSKGFGVVVIIPRVLYQNQEVMKMTNLYSLL